MVTMQEVADHAHVSRATVSRVLTSHPSIRPETRNEVMYWVRKLGYQPNTVAQSLAGNRTNLIGVLVPDISNPLYSDILASIEEEAAKEGYSIIVGNSGRQKEREANIIHNFMSRRVDGIILRPIGEEEDRIYGSIKVPAVSIFKQFSRFNCVMVDSEEGSKLIADHFVSLGHRRIGYLGPLKAPKGNDKLLGFQKALSAYGIELDTILECQQHEVAENQKAYQIFSEYLSAAESGVTAWYAHNDIAACDIMRALEERNVKVPEDVIVAGYNDTLLAKKMFPTITSVAQPVREVGRNIVSILVGQIREEEEARELELIKLSPRLSVRESTTGTYVK